MSKKFAWCAWLLLPVVAFACDDRVVTSTPGDAEPADAPLGDARAADGSVADSGAADSATRDASLDAGASFDSGSDAAVSDAAVSVDASNDAGADSGPPPVPEVHYVGRWDRSRPGIALGSFPALRAIAAFRGTSAQVSIRALSGGPSIFNLVVDNGAPSVVTVAANTTRMVTLAQGLALGDHTVELYRRVEPFVGETELSQWVFPGGTLLAPPPAPTRRIEFVGNSTSTGYGVDGVRGTASCTGNIDATHNAQPSLIGLLPTALNAELYAPSMSGTGVLYNVNLNDTLTIEKIYVRTLGRTPSTWDFSRWQPHVIVVAIGGTDFANPNIDPPPTVAAFSVKYAQFLALVRSNNPLALIVVGISGTISDNYPNVASNGVRYLARTNLKAGVAAAIAIRTQAGDANIDRFEFSPTNDLTGCDFHPSAAAYQVMSAELSTYLRAKLNW